MALKDLTLFGDVDKVGVAVKRLKTFEPKDGYWVGISGGKDSTVIYDLVKRSGVKAEFHHSMTTIDPPEVMRFMREYMPDVEIIRPGQSLFKRMLKEGIPPLRYRRWCCREYKEHGGDGRVIVTGVRSEESVKRKGRRMVEKCYNKPNTSFLHVIIDWTEIEVWEYIKKRELPYCSLYDEGQKRIGCLFCPNNRNVEQQKKRWPKMYKAWRKAIYRLYYQQREKGKLQGYDNPEAYFQWWLSGDRSSVDPNQLTIFE